MLRIIHFFEKRFPTSTSPWCGIVSTLRRCLDGSNLEKELEMGFWILKITMFGFSMSGMILDKWIQGQSNSYTEGGCDHPHSPGRLSFFFYEIEFIKKESRGKRGNKMAILPKTPKRDQLIKSPIHPPKRQKYLKVKELMNKRPINKKTWISY